MIYLKIHNPERQIRNDFVTIIAQQSISQTIFLYFSVA